MKKITFVIPSRNNLALLKLAYKSLKALGNGHYILVLNDASTDGTEEWLHMMLNKFWKEKQEDKLTVHTNPGPDRVGIVGMFDKGIEMAETDIICLLTFIISFNSVTHAILWGACIFISSPSKSAL